MEKLDLSRLTEETTFIAQRKVSFIRTGGHRTAVLLIHGNSCCKEIFLNQITFLADLGHDVVVPDLPGHGSSDNAADAAKTYSFPGYAATLVALMNKLGIDTYHVIGWSLGGHIGIEMWITETAALSLLITGTPPVRLSAAGAAEGFVPSEAMDLAGKPEFSSDDLRTYGVAMLGEAFDPSSQFGRCIARTHCLARRLMLENGLAGVGHDQVRAVATCPKPLAIIQGKSDPFVNLSYLKDLAYKNLWLAKPVLVSGGHAPHWTHPQEFNEHLMSFFAAA